MQLHNMRSLEKKIANGKDFLEREQILQMLRSTGVLMLAHFRSSCWFTEDFHSFLGESSQLSTF